MRCVTIPTRAVTRLFAICTLAIHASAVAANADDVQFPDTHAGRCAKAFFDAIGSGDADKIRAFETEYRAENPTQPRSIDDRVKLAQQLHGRWPDFRVVRIERSAERDLSVIATTGGEPAYLRLTFNFESQPPYKMTSVMIEGGVDPEETATEPVALDAETRGKVIHGVLDALDEEYVYPEVAAKMRAAVEQHMRDGQYDDLTNPTLLASRLTEDLRAVSNDRHLALRAGEHERVQRHIPGEDAEREAADNYGFKQAEVLPGNIGYIKLNSFNPSDEAKRTADAALAFVAHCDALIFDLRENGGGSPEMIQHISSYLLDKPTHLNSFYDNRGNKTSETWTTESVNGQRFAADLPVFVLTSSYTFSGAEEFTYNLKNLKRATIVGETTGGGAHPVTARNIADHFTLVVPFARAYNPITKTNWEGVGVTPDVKTDASDALDKARELAREKIAARTKAE